MRNSYIANTHEAAALHSGKQTAVVVKMKVQPTPNKFNPEKVDFEFRNSKQNRAGRNLDVQNLNDQFFGILDFAPYQLGQEVYVREKWYKGGFWQHPQLSESVSHIEDEPWFWHKITVVSIPESSRLTYLPQSPATMPQSAARTRFKVVDVEAVRVRDVSEEQAVWLNIRSITKDGVKYKYGLCGDDGLPFGSGWKWCDFKDGFSDAWQTYIISKFGQQAWDENHFIWYFKIEKI